MREDFEKWFFENYSELFNKEKSPLHKDNNGIYTDRGTLGMWIVWKYKEDELYDIKIKIKEFLVHKGFIMSNNIESDKGDIVMKQ